jgi:hypothetical protein
VELRIKKLGKKLKLNSIVDPYYIFSFVGGGKKEEKGRKSKEKGIKRKEKKKLKVVLNKNFVLQC